MSSLFRLRQVLRGRLGKYIITKEIQDTVWFANLIYGGNFTLFRPHTVSSSHEEYGLEVLKRHFRYFGPFPAKYEEIASPQTIAAILYLMEEIPQSQTTPFHRTTEKEACQKDKELIGKIMMLDWRDRPTAGELLENEWFKEDGKEE
ncbi:hypothetical protein BKA65DRAFT_555622 [Rhexocercosporidium sp. MPI-PUGE-AT-0058]|nr:hypothetical protein BKA65DRAFT_555622 [Rhexocercosporidium sp. MPI-PUGE-AT-0058]